MTAPQEDPHPIIERELPDPLKKNLSGWLRGVLILTGVAAAAVLIFCISAYEPDNTTPPPNEYEVRGACEDWVADKLKSPSTAKFSNHNVRATGDSAWAVSCDVDSQNGFGAMIRTPWTCSIYLDGETFRGSVDF